VTHILPPKVNSSTSSSSLDAAMYRLVTEPASWTREEKWKNRPRFTDEGTDDEVDFLAPVVEPNVATAFEEEVASIAEPQSLEILIEGTALDLGRLDSYIGIELRGRWGLVGSAKEHTGWWIFKAKDCALQSQSRHDSE
jgi:hypothetical protein